MKPVMTQFRGLIGFLLLMMPPWLPFLYARQFKFQMPLIGDLSSLLVCALSILLSLSGVVFYLRFRARDFTFSNRLGHINFALCVLDSFIFYLVNSGDPSRANCGAGVECHAHPFLWLTLAWMHFFYAIQIYSINLSPILKEA